MTTCKICGGESRKLFTEKVLAKYDVDYFQCTQCGFGQTTEPFWLQEAYESAINFEDTGIMSRNLLFRKFSDKVISNFLDKKATFLDYAGGYGIFTRLMRDWGYDYYWEDDYATNLIARGFEHKKGTRYEAITAFEVFEHFTDPHTELEKMLTYTDTVIFSTRIFSEPAPATDWWYYAFYHGQHVAFHSVRSLEVLARKHGLHLCTNGKSFHMFSRKKISNSRFNTLLKMALLPLDLSILKEKNGFIESDSLALSKLR